MGFLTGSTKTQATQQTVASGVSIQSSVYGGPIPIVYGQTRLTGNLIWYGDFQAIAPTSNQSSGGKGLGGGGSGGKNGGGSTSTDYKASFAFALGEGPFSAIETVWASKTETAFGSSGLGFESGAAGQTPWGYLTTYHSGQDLAYQGTAYVTAQTYDLGDSAQMPNLSFEITGQGANAITGQPDADPAFVVEDFLTSAAYGAGFPSARIGDLSIYSNYCRAAGLVISPLFDTQQDAASTLNDIVQQTNAEFVWSGGQLTVVPYGDMALNANGGIYNPPTEALFSLTDDDFLDDGSGGDPVQLVRTRPSDQMNSIKLEWLNRGNQYNPEIVEAKDQAAIEIYGLRTNQSQQSHYFCNLAAATMSATLQLQRQAVRNQYSFTLGWKYCLLDPMDIVEVTDANLGLSQQWVRILSVEEDDNGNLKITAEEYLGGAGGAPLYSYQTGSPFIANYNIAPGAINEPVIFEPSGELTGGAPQVWVGVSGGANWGGADVWLSIDNATYSRVGRIAGPARQGLLHAPLALGGDPDTVNTLSVDLSESGGALLSGTMADADAFRTLCYVDGELISYETASLTGGSLYGLTYLRRGLFGAPAAAHSAGTQFCRLDDAVLKIDLPLQPVSYVGQTIYLKLTSYNIYGGGQEQIADVSAYSYNPAGTGTYVAPPSACAISVGTERQPDGTIVPFMEISWTASPDPLFDEYEVQWRLHDGPGAWQSQKVGPNVTSFTVIPVQPLTAFDAQVRAIRNKGGPFFSAWSQDLNVLTIFKTTPPPAPTSLSVVGGYRQITIDWVASAENDIAWYEVWESADSNLSDASRIGLINATHYVRPGLNLSDTRYYWVRAQDTSGNFSSFLGPGSSTTLGVDSSDIIGAIVGSQIAANTLAASNLINGLNIVQVVTTISAADHTVSNVAYAEDTATLYNWNGSSFVASGGVTPGSVTLADFASGITPVQVVSTLPGSATEGQMAVLTGNGQLYRYHAGAWTAAVPAANVTGTLTASQIASITAAQLTGQITTTQITPGAVTTPLLAAGAVESANIAAGAVTAGTIAANAVTTGAIAAGAITAGTIAANAVTTATIAAGAVSAAQIAAGAVIASKLYVGDTTNLILDPQAQDPAYWNLGAATYFETYLPSLEAVGAPSAITINLSAAPLNAYSGATASSFINVTPNNEYNLSAVISNAGATYPLVIGINFYDSTHTYLTGGNAPSSASGTSTLNYPVTPPANACYALVYLLCDVGSSAGSGYWCFSNIQLVRKLLGSLVVDGTVTAAQIAAGTITATQIAAGTITAAQIEAAGITGDRIAANTITATNLAVNSVTAASILGGTITGDKIAGNFFQGYSFSASSGTGSGQSVIYGGNYTSGGSVTGPYNLIQDDSGNNRVLMGRLSGAWGLWVWDASGNAILEASQLASGVVQTVNIAGNGVTYLSGAQLSAGTNIYDASGFITLWSHTAEADGELEVTASIAWYTSYPFNAASVDLQITVNGTVVGNNGTAGATGSVTTTCVTSVSASDTIIVQAQSNISPTYTNAGTVSAIIAQR